MSSEKVCHLLARGAIMLPLLAGTIFQVNPPTKFRKVIEGEIQH